MRAARIIKRTLSATGILVALVNSGCAGLTLSDFVPGSDDRRVTMEALRSQNREADRVIVQLRRDLYGRRQELAAVRVMRAQLEGRVREIERRYTESRQIVGLQRGELARLRAERAAVLETGREVQADLADLRNQLVTLRPRGERRSQPAGDRGAGSGTGTVSRVGLYRTREYVSPAAAAARASAREARMNGHGDEVDVPSDDVVYVRWGDTLSHIALRYRVNVADLARLNNLAGNPDLIFPGQALRLPPRSVPGSQ